MTSPSTARPEREVRDTVVIRFAGDSGDGMQLTGLQFTQETALAGSDLATFPDYPAEIRAPAGTTFGVSAFQIHFGALDITSENALGALLDSLGAPGFEAYLAEGRDAQADVEAAAEETGVIGAPTYQVGEHLFVGREQTGHARGQRLVAGRGLDDEPPPLLFRYEQRGFEQFSLVTLRHRDRQRTRPAGRSELAPV